MNMARDFSFLLKPLKFISKKPELAFVALALTFGLIYTFKLAPLRGTDEFTHFARVYQISEGTLWEQKVPGNNYGGQLPSNVNNMINDFRVLTYQNFSSSYIQQKNDLISKYGHISSPGNTKVTADFTSSYLYPPWDYAETIVGLLIAKLAHMPLVWYVYLARITSLIFYVAVVWLAIRLLPAGKWFLTALALVPTALTQAATVSADGLIISLSWLIFALTVSVLAKKVKLNLKTMSILTALSVIMCVLKIGYIFIALFPLIIPASYFKDRITARWWKSVTLSLAAVASILFVGLGLRNVSNTPTVLYPGLNVNPHKQMHYILTHPFVYIYRDFAWLFSYTFDIIYHGVVGVVTNRVITIPVGVILLIYLGLFLTYERVKPVEKLKEHIVRLRTASVVVLIGTYLFISTAFYIDASGVGSSTLNGMWGRYFLPIIPFVILFPLTSKRKLNFKPNSAFIGFICLIIIYSLADTMLFIN